jgi:hypothetical protein
MDRLAVGTTLRRALQLCRAEWWPLLVLAVMVEIPVVIADSLSIHFLDIEVGGGGPRRDAVLAGLLLLLWTTLAHHVLLAAVEEVEASHRRGQSRTRIVAVLRGLPMARLLLADVVITAAFIVGVVFLIIPGLLVVVWTTPVFPLLSMERQPVRATIRRSIQVVRGSAWRVLVVIGSVWLAGQIVGGFVTGFLHAAPVIETIVHHLVVLAFEPLGAAAVVVATYELVAIDRARRQEAAAT